MTILPKVPMFSTLVLHTLTSLVLCVLLTEAMGWTLGLSLDAGVELLINLWTASLAVGFLRVVWLIACEQ